MIRNTVLCICAVLIMFCTDRSNQAGAAQFADQNIKLPKVSALALENGVRLFYIRGELPQVTLVALVGFGRLYENQNNAGISDLIARTLSLGGSKKYPSGTLHDLIDSMGGTFSVESSWEHTAISIKVLDRFRSEAFSILSDFIQNPNFEPRYFDTAKALLADSIKRKLENPTEIAFGKAREIIFNGNGYGSFPTPEKISSFSLNQVQDTWHRYCAGKNILIGIHASGDLSETESLARSSFSSIAAGTAVDYSADKGAIAKAIRDASGTVFFYHKEIPQSTIVVGTMAPDIRYAGAYSLEVMNYVLGGGSFNSRLMREIRVNRGLAYSVQSVIKCRNNTGLFMAFAQTENKNAFEVLSLLTKNIERVTHENMQPGELDWAKTSIRNSYIFQFNTPLSILSNYMEIAYNNLPQDYFITYLDQIQSVRALGILEEARGLLQFGTVTVVVGGEEAAGNLAKHWKVVRIK